MGFSISILPGNSWFLIRHEEKIKVCSVRGLETDKFFFFFFRSYKSGEVRDETSIIFVISECMEINSINPY